MNTTNVPTVCIVIVNYNGIALLRQHLPSVLNTKYQNYKVVVVDNGSSDKSVDFLRSTYPEIDIIENDENLGFGRANNVAFQKKGNYDYFALLNNDIDVTPDWLGEIIELMEGDTKIGAVGPRLLYSKKSDDQYVINSAGGIIDKYDRGFDRFEGCPDGVQYATIEEVGFVTGGAMVLRNKAVKSVGGFDERMFFYYEDIDLCIRLRDAGWKIVYDGRSIVYHDHNGTVKTWKASKTTIAVNMNRIKSILRRKGVVAAGIELVRSPLEWLIYSLYGKIAGTTFRQMILNGKYTCRTKD